MMTHNEATTPQEQPSPYQRKLDFGEGADCHTAYEKFLDTTRLPDSTKLWLAFSSAWLTGVKR
jgi:hypothetical protein